MSVLEDSLGRKVVVLDDIMALSEEQEKLLKQEKLDLEAFDELIDKKDALAEELTRLDDGFEALYGRIKNQLQDNKEAYRTQITAMQKLIAEITEKTVSIQAKEERNKELLSKQLATLRQDMKQNRRTSKAAYDYYMNMGNAGAAMSQFMDQKK